PLSRDHRDLPSLPTRRSSDLSPLRAGKSAAADHEDVLRRDLRHPDDLAGVDVEGDDRIARRLLRLRVHVAGRRVNDLTLGIDTGDRKSTRLNSSHEWISYAVF